MSEHTKLFERAAARYEVPEMSTDGLLRRRDRKHRNQRIAAGVVGIAVFVAAVWIVMSGVSLDRSETPAATGPVETVPAPAPASAAPNVSKHHCSDGVTRLRLELMDLGAGDGIEVRFEVHDSPPGHLWHIRMWRVGPFIDAREIWRGARMASDTGDFAVVRLTGRSFGWRVKAIDSYSATGEVCKVNASLHY
jgi:hypothetical protein